MSFTGATGKCDGTDIEDWNVWYRVSGGAGNALASKNPPQNDSCGTYPGRLYLKDDHPDFSDGEVDRTVCITSKRYTCRKEINIKVINCGAFYLYRLVKLRDCAYTWRYCTNGQGT